MAQRPLRKCRHSQCGALHRNANGFCNDHQKQQRPDNRPNAAARGYDNRWNKFRKWYLSRNQLCSECKKAGRTTAANVVHHKIPLADGGNQYDPSNCAALCRDCHEQAHGRRNG